MVRSANTISSKEFGESEDPKESCQVINNCVSFGFDRTARLHRKIQILEAQDT